MEVNEQLIALKQIVFVGSSLKDLKSFPKKVQSEVGHALLLAQRGEKHLACKVLKGFKGAGVLEIIEDFDGDTYRSVYTVQFEGIIYVLHSFQKKSKHGIATPLQDMNLIEERLKRARLDHNENHKEL